MNNANVGTWERPCVCFVDAGLEALQCKDEVYVVLNLPIVGMPGCYLRQLVRVENVGKGDWWLFVNSRSLHTLLLVSPIPNLPTVPVQCWYASGPMLAFQLP